MSSTDDPEKLLNEWLGELETIIGDLDFGNKKANNQQLSPSKPAAAPGATLGQSAVIHRTNRSSRSSDFNRFSMANLEDTHEHELDAILGELSQLEMDKNAGGEALKQKPISSQQVPSSSQYNLPHPHHHSHHHHHERSNSIVSSSGTSTISLDVGSLVMAGSVSGIGANNGGGSGNVGSSYGSENGSREARTESPDNDSAFSDTVSLLSSDTSSTSSGLVHHPGQLAKTNLTRAAALQLQDFDSQKAAKIHLALQKLEQASVRRLFVKAFTMDGASKSLLVDETMTCGHVTRLLVDKNHVQLDCRWALVEHLPDIQMERLYEDHELLVDKLMLWNRDSKNKILFVERPEKVALFMRPELYLGDNVGITMAKDHDECNRAYILDEFFNTNSQIPIDGPLYLKADSKKAWKRYHFVLRGSGLYYFPKEKTRSSRDLVCLSLFNEAEVYKGFGWKKRYKAPTDHTFILHSATELANSKTTKPLKILCADDAAVLERWVLAIRIAKYGKQLYQSYRALREELAREDLDEISTRRSSSINSIIGSATSQGANGSKCGGSNGRLSRASSSSSSGCLSDENNGFDSEFPMGTIKRKPSMKPNIPLTSMTRQLMEVGENRQDCGGVGSGGVAMNGDDSVIIVGSPERGGTLTRRPQHHSRQRSIDSSGGSSAGSGTSTLKRRPVAERKEMDQHHHHHRPEMIGDEGHHKNGVISSPLKSMPSCMTDSLFSLPPPPEEDDLAATQVLGSMLSLETLPPPPTPNELEESMSSSDRVDCSSTTSSATFQNGQQQFIYDKHSAMSPPLPSPSQVQMMQAATPIYSTAVRKSGELESCLKKPEKIYSVPSKGAASPVTLRKKVCFEDQVMVQPQSPVKRITSSTSSSSSIYGSLPPKPPPRSEATRLSTQPSRSGSPNNEFLKDLQRVMRKKWQVAQKCKLEPETNPHEVLGFRDFNAWQQQNQLPFYRETANVSNWVQEHYGPDSLYENLGVDPLENGAMPIVVVPAAKKRPPPLPPKRSDTTQLTMIGSTTGAGSGGASVGGQQVPPTQCLNS